jgi:hypothetical protein
LSSVQIKDTEILSQLNEDHIKFLIPAIGDQIKFKKVLSTIATAADNHQVKYIPTHIVRTVSEILLTPFLSKSERGTKPVYHQRTTTTVAENTCNGSAKKVVVFSENKAIKSTSVFQSKTHGMHRAIPHQQMVLRSRISTKIHQSSNQHHVHAVIVQRSEFLVQYLSFYLNVSSLFPHKSSCLTTNK